IRIRRQSEAACGRHGRVVHLRPGGTGAPAGPPFDCADCTAIARSGRARLPWRGSCELAAGGAKWAQRIRAADAFRRWPAALSSVLPTRPALPRIQRGCGRRRSRDSGTSALDGRVRIQCRRVAPRRVLCQVLHSAAPRPGEVSLSVALLLRERGSAQSRLATILASALSLSSALGSSASDTSVIWNVMRPFCPRILGAYRYVRSPIPGTFV